MQTRPLIAMIPICSEVAVVLKLHKIVPLLLQSERAFSSHYHILQVEITLNN